MYGKLSMHFDSPSVYVTLKTAEITEVILAQAARCRYVQNRIVIVIGQRIGTLRIPNFSTTTLSFPPFSQKHLGGLGVGVL